jgi:NADH dehydrogenase
VRRSGLGWTIFRPSIIYGPGDNFVNLFAKIIRFSPVVPVAGGGGARFQPVAVKAVGAAFVKALTEPRAIGETCDLCGPEAFTLGEVVNQILAVMRKKRLKFHVPSGIAWCQAAVFEFVFPRLFHRAPPLNRDQLTLLQEDNVGNGQPANELFGLKFTPFKEGIAGYVK